MNDQGPQESDDIMKPNHPKTLDGYVSNLQDTMTPEQIEEALATNRLTKTGADNLIKTPEEAAQDPKIIEGPGFRAIVKSPQPKSPKK